MIELPERLALVRQLNETIEGKTIEDAEANHTPHGFAEYTGDPAEYPAKLRRKRVAGASLEKGELRIQAGDMDLMITTPMRYHQKAAKRPEKHQLLLAFEDGSALSCSVSMWGAMLLFPRGEAARQGPQWLREAMGRVAVTPLDEAFTAGHLRGLMPLDGKSLSLKGVLATGQRIPGIGNGVIQDVLFEAGLLPMRDARTLSDAEWERLHRATVDVVARMAALGGRDTEKDLLGKPGGYATVLSRKTYGQPCPRCGGIVLRRAYMGGSVYFCPRGQR